MNVQSYPQLRLLTGALFALLLVGCAKVPLYNGLIEKEANEMIAILMSEGITVDKMAGAENTWNLSIDSQEVARAVDILNRYGYPKDNFQSIGEVFKKSGLVSSPSEERIRFMYALSQEISETLTQIDGVLTARVHIVLPDNDPLNDSKSPSSASVFIKYRRGTGVDSLTSQIKKLVTNSIEGLAYEKVTLVFVASDLSQLGDISIAGNQADEETDARVYVIIAMIIFLLLVIAGAGGYWFLQSKKVQTRTSSVSVTAENAEDEEAA